MSRIEEDLGALVEDLDHEFIAEWENLKRQLRDLKEEQKRAILVPTLKKD